MRRYILFVLLFSALHVWSQSYEKPMPTNLLDPVAILNYTDDKQVEKNKKLELGIPVAEEIKNKIDNFILKRWAKEDRLNPFVEWEIDVDAVFTHINSGNKIKIEGFYTREYERIVGTKRINGRSYTDDWVDIDSIPGKKNNYPFRIRFAPQEIGEWVAQVQLKVKGKRYHVFEPVRFFVIDNSSPGYVHIHKNQVNLVRDGEVIFPVGHNIVSPDGAVAWGGDDAYPGKNHFSPSQTHKAANTQVWDVYLKEVNDFLTAGGKYMRDMQRPWMNLIEFEEKGNYFNRLHYAQETDALIELCEQHGALMNFNLMIHEPFMNYGDYSLIYWDWGLYDHNGEREERSWLKNYPVFCYNNQPFGRKQPHESMLDASDLNYHKQRTRYYVARYGYSTSIYLFEILNEPFHVNQHGNSPESDFSKPSAFHTPSSKEGQEVRKAVYNYHKVLADYMRDTLKVNQLIGVDMGQGTSEYYEDFSFDSLSVSIPSVDIVGINYYYLYPNSLYVSDGASELLSTNNRVYDVGGNSFASTVELIWYLRDHHLKRRIPVMFSEGGIGENYIDCSNLTQFYVDMMTYPFSKVAGYNAWYGWKDHQKVVRSATIRTEKFFNETERVVDVFQGTGKWEHGKMMGATDKQLRNGARFPKETQYYISADQKLIVGYVRNLSYNAGTQGNCEGVTFEQAAFNELTWFDFKKGRKFKIDGLNKKKNYNIEYYSFLHTDFGKGQLIEVDQQKARNKKLTLKFPSLDPWNPKTGPVLWFIIREEE